MKSAHPPTTKRTIDYRTVDIVVVTFIGVAFGAVYWGWDKVYEPISGLAVFTFPPSAALIYGIWLMAGVVGGLVVRKPGAAFGAEFIAAGMSALIVGGNQWGMSTFIAGALQGAGAEIVFAVLLYRRWGWGAAVAAGAGAAVFECIYEWQAYYADWGFDYKLIYLGFFMLSGAVIAGVGGWAMVRGLARTGALDAFPIGREVASESAARLV